jgi:hypothetical protein
MLIYFYGEEWCGKTTAELYLSRNFFITQLPEFFFQEKTDARDELMSKICSDNRIYVYGNSFKYPTTCPVDFIQIERNVYKSPSSIHNNGTIDQFKYKVMYHLKIKPIIVIFLFNELFPTEIIRTLKTFLH